MNLKILPNVVLRECAKRCSQEQFKEIKEEANLRNMRLKEPIESKELKVNDIYFIALKLKEKISLKEFRTIASYVQKELNK